jgi:hypothetical protein
MGRIRHAGRLAAGLILALGVAAHGDFTDRGAPVGDDGVISADNLGENEVWPLTIVRGTFRCEGTAVFIVSDGIAYPLDGAAKALMRQAPGGRKPLEEIWKADAKAATDLRASGVAVEVVRLDITPVLQRGSRWCQEHR